MTRPSVRRGGVTATVLKIIGAAGLLSASMVAPNALQTLEQFGLLGSSEAQDRVYIKTVLTRLKRQGLIMFVGNKIKLTPDGEKKLAKYQLRELTIPTPRKWDGRYRVLIFDIKEDRREVRDKLRIELHNLGFYMIQQSVWVYPYDCEEVIALLKVYLKLGWSVVYMVVERIDNDQRIREYFDMI